jgi:hypothetical protein
VSVTEFQAHGVSLSFNRFLRIQLSSFSAF